MREYLRLLHLPTTSCILAFALMGSTSAPIIYFDRLLWLLIQLFLSGGIAANYFDELIGRPWHTTMPRIHLWSIGFVALAASSLIGLYFVVTLSFEFAIFVVLWAFFTLAYDLELFNGRFHNTPSLAFSWSSIYLGSYYLQSLTITPSSLLLSAVLGYIAGQGRNLYEEAKPFSKDRITSSPESTKSAWTLLKTLIIFINVIALIMLSYRLIL